MDNEEIITLDTMREKQPKQRPTRSYMSGPDLTNIRTKVLRVTYRALAEQLIRPDTGEPVSIALLCRWAKGNRSVPRWAAQRILQLAEIARRNDTRR